MCDRKERRIGTMKKREIHSVSFVRKSMGETHAVINTIEARRKFFQEKKLCFNCGRAGHWGQQLRRRGRFKCKSRHHTSLCDKNKNRPTVDNGTALTSYSPSADEWSLPDIIPVKIKGETVLGIPRHWSWEEFH